MMFRPALILLCSFAICASTTHSTPKIVFAFPESLTEVSGIALNADKTGLYALEDKGNNAYLYEFDLKGNLIKTLSVAAHNNDWEDLTTDPQGNLYIGDFGNNDNERKNLAILKIDRASLSGKNVPVAAKTQFFYPEQSSFPPRKNELWYDAESFFYYKENFYIFTKNRSAKSDGTTLLYRVPAKPGSYAAKMMGTFPTCRAFHQCAVSSAAISPDGKKVALLGGIGLWLFEDFQNDNFLKGKVRQIFTGPITQKEALCFANNNTLYVADERRQNTGGNVYEVITSQ